MKNGLDLLQHSLGVDQYGRGEMYRNRFVAGNGHHDMPIITQLVRDGLMEEGHPSFGAITGGSSVFFVTKAGIEYVLKQSPKPSRKTKAQERYSRYLDCKDFFSSFVDFCRYDAVPDCDKERYCIENGLI